MTDELKAAKEKIARLKAVQDRIVCVLDDFMKDGVLGQETDDYKRGHKDCTDELTDLIHEIIGEEDVIDARDAEAKRWAAYEDGRDSVGRDFQSAAELRAENERLRAALELIKKKAGDALFDC